MNVKNTINNLVFILIFKRAMLTMLNNKNNTSEDLSPENNIANKIKK